jgi:hypothetical protein
MCNPLFRCSRCHLPCPLLLRPYTTRSMHLCTSTVGQNCDVGMFFCGFCLCVFVDLNCDQLPGGAAVNVIVYSSQFLLTYLCTFSNLLYNSQQFLRILPITCFYISNDIRFQVKILVKCMHISVANWSVSILCSIPMLLCGYFELSRFEYLSARVSELEDDMLH